MRVLAAVMVADYLCLKAGYLTIADVFDAIASIVH